ncbi:MAG: hypothetical protein NC307_15945 [Roseburia sp.]|nr:hypothetical protein [Roseburia sp.]
MKNIMENNLLMDDSLRLMRIKERPIHSDENLLVMDWLEKGFLRLYEYTGGSIYISGDAAGVNTDNNVAMVAELTVSLLPERKEVKLEKMFSEFGYGFGELLKDQLRHFADFYGYSIVLLDLSKPDRKCA